MYKLTTLYAMAAAKLTKKGHLILYTIFVLEIRLLCCHAFYPFVLTMCKARFSQRIETLLQKRYMFAALCAVSNKMNQQIDELVTSHSLFGVFTSFERVATFTFIFLFRAQHTMYKVLRSARGKIDYFVNSSVNLKFHQCKH